MGAPANLARRTAGGALCAIAIAAALGLAFTGIALTGCARKVPAQRQISYPYSSASPRVFYATEVGLVGEAPTKEAGAAAEAALPASRAPNASVLSSDGVSISAAINGWGVARIECAPPATGAQKAVGLATGAYRIDLSPQHELFSGLSTGGSWPVKGGTLVQLYRDPFTEAGGATSGGDATTGLATTRLVFLDGSKGGGAKALDPFASMAGPGYELFALLPSGGSWFAELRKDSPERVDLKFLALGDPLAAEGAGSVREIRRSDFEAALKPKALSSLGGDSGLALRAALASLGKRAWLVRLRSSAGDDAWYLSSGLPEDALPVYAWSTGSAVLALRSDGWLAIGDSRGARSLSRLELPREDAAFTALAAAGDLAADGNLVAAAWEAGIFPSLEAAGLVVERIARPAKRDTIQE